MYLGLVLATAFLSGLSLGCPEDSGDEDKADIVGTWTATVPIDDPSIGTGDL
jgi:hypothetical protein